MFKKLFTISLATLSLASLLPAAARADLVTDPTPALVVSAAVTSAYVEPIEISLEGRFIPRHQESPAFWDKFDELVYPGGAGAGGDGGGGS